MWLLVGFAVVLVVIGASVLLLSPATFGWTLDAPLSGESFSFSGMYPLTPERATGGALAILGLLLIAAIAGWALGRRSDLAQGR